MFISWQQKAVVHPMSTLAPGLHRRGLLSVTVFRDRVLTHVVKIANRECSCGKWNQFDIPCSHAKKVCGAYNISTASMVKDYYDVIAYNNTYSKHFEPVQSEDYWDDPNFQLVHDPTIRTVTVEMVVEYGDPRDVICEVAEKLKVDFLVMGSHGYGLIKRAFIGSVSNHCARNVKCPVLVVKKPKSNDVHH
ncbi:hypothetical protein Sango_0954000 [Sesamum angolense]|uniref:SWIM-type domain-containing protein n=1 Tax=Sesamum angolense TaxID=2727404 RepID=A0AAE1WZG5_9LAMI|nr:hypothetical protein Sango_0954000 [Sesamum angolense]